MPRERINLQQKTCPNRENTIGSIKTFYGDIDTIIRETAEGTLKRSSRSFQQSGGCVLTTGLFRLATLRGGVVLNHAPIGCASMLYGYRLQYNNIPQELGRPPIDFHWISSNLGEDDIVFGGEEKLKQTILEAEKRYAPGAIFIITSCASGIMGDDVEGVIQALQPEIKARLVPIHCEGFRSEVPQTGFDAIWHGILKYLVEEPKEKQEDLVNLAVPFSVTWGDRQELIRLLARLGLRVNCIPELATVEQLKSLGEAALTVTTCNSFGTYLQQALYERYGVPYVKNPIPIGINQTAEWLRRVAEATGRSHLVERIIQEELELINPQIENLKKRIDARKSSFFISAGQGRAVSLPLLARELGMEISGISSLEYDEENFAELTNIREKCGDYKFHVAEYQAFEQSAIIDELKPDIYFGCAFIGSVYKRDAGLARMHSYRSDFSSFGQQFGFRGAVAYGHVILRALSNHSLNRKLGQHLPKPYKSWWKDQNPLSYVKEN